MRLEGGKFLCQSNVLLFETKNSFLNYVKQSVCQLYKESQWVNYFFLILLELKGWIGENKATERMSVLHCGLVLKSASKS